MSKQKLIRKKSQTQWICNNKKKNRCDCNGIQVDDITPLKCFRTTISAKFNETNFKIGNLKCHLNQCFLSQLKSIHCEKKNSMKMLFPSLATKKKHTQLRRN